MARYVILSFEDNEQAEAFCTRAMSGPVAGVETYHVDPDRGGTNTVYDAEVVGLVAKPTKFCEGHTGGGKHGQSYTKGSKWGWWVCITCAKPSRLWAAGYKGVLSHGRNLLFPDGDRPSIPFWEIPPVVPVPERPVVPDSAKAPEGDDVLDLPRTEENS
jgi:hypothetical protein